MSRSSPLRKLSGGHVTTAHGSPVGCGEQASNDSNRITILRTPPQATPSPDDQAFFDSSAALFRGGLLPGWSGAEWTGRSEQEAHPPTFAARSSSVSWQLQLCSGPSGRTISFSCRLFSLDKAVSTSRPGVQRCPSRRLIRGLVSHNMRVGAGRRSFGHFPFGQRPRAKPVVDARAAE